MIIEPKYKWVVLIAVLGVLVGVYILKVKPEEYGNDNPQVSFTPLVDDKIVLVEPAAGSHISSPVTVRGRARGPWFFEASFPVTLTNKDGAVIGQGYVQAQGEWMTTEFVDFEGVVTFTQPPEGQQGTLILHKANASGLPEHDDSREVTVYFK